MASTLTAPSFPLAAGGSSLPAVLQLDIGAERVMRPAARQMACQLPTSSPQIPQLHLFLLNPSQLNSTGGTWTHLKTLLNKLPPLHDLTIATDNLGLLEGLFTTHLIPGCANLSKSGRCQRFHSVNGTACIHKLYVIDPMMLQIFKKQNHAPSSQPLPLGIYLKPTVNCGQI